MDINGVLVGASTLLLPIVVALFKREINSLYVAWAIYHSRPFDQDRNPLTPDRCQLYNEATGVWENVLIEKYQFSWKRDQRGVFICHSATDGSTASWARERLPFDVWAAMRKRSMPETEEEHPLEVNLPILKE